VADSVELRDLGTIVGPTSLSNSIAYDINSNQDVVGASDITLPGTVMHAFIWKDDVVPNGVSDPGEMKDLNVLAANIHWELQDARAINDAGQIVGTGIKDDDPTHTHAFLLNPTGFSATPCSAAPTTVSAVSGSGVYNAPATLTATLKSLSGPLSGRTINFSIDSVSACGGVGQPACPATNASGVATVNVSGYSGGSHTLTVSFAGDASFASSNSAGTLTISKANQTITVNSNAPGTATYNSSFTVAATASSSLTVTYSSGSPTICTNSGATFTMISGTGTCVVRYDQAGDGNYNAATQVIQ